MLVHNRADSVGIDHLQQSGVHSICDTLGGPGRILRNGQHAGKRMD